MLTRKENNWITGIYFGFWFVVVAFVVFVIYGVFYNPLALFTVILVIAALVGAIYGLYRFNNRMLDKQESVAKTESTESTEPTVASVAVDKSTTTDTSEETTDK